MSKIAYPAIALLLSSCCAPKPLATQQQERDSIRVEYRERTVFVPDTVFVQVPAQTAERTTADSLSHLENEYAASDARLNADGTLTHTLSSKPQAKAFLVARRVEYRDSVVYRDRVVRRTETVTEYVERKRSWWEQSQLYGFWAAIALLAVTYRREILKATVRLFLPK